MSYYYLTFNLEKALYYKDLFSQVCSPLTSILPSRCGSRQWLECPQYTGTNHMPVYEGINQVYTEALGVLFPVDSMDSGEEMMIQDWTGALYKKDDTAFLCWTYSPEVTYVLEYTPSKIDYSDVIKMVESAEPVA